MTILSDIKSYCSVHEDEDGFDDQLLRIIDASLLILNDLTGWVKKFDPVTKSTTWDEVLSNSKSIPAVIAYVGMRSQELFDPSASATIAETRARVIKELEWRLCQ